MQCCSRSWVWAWEKAITEMASYSPIFISDRRLNPLGSQTVKSTKSIHTISVKSEGKSTITDPAWVYLPYCAFVTAEPQNHWLLLVWAATAVVITQTLPWPLMRMSGATLSSHLWPRGLKMTCSPSRATPLIISVKVRDTLHTPISWLGGSQPADYFNRARGTKDSLVLESLPSCLCYAPYRWVHPVGLGSRTRNLGEAFFLMIWVNGNHGRKQMIESESDLHSQGPEGCTSHVGLQMPSG